MIIFFGFNKAIKTYQNEFGFSYEHKFDKMEVGPENQLSFNHIYFSTPSDFHSHIDNIKSQLGEDAAKDVKIIEPPQIVNHPNFPMHIGFFKQWDKMIADIQERYPGKGKLNLAISNAMSNAIGDTAVNINKVFQEQGIGGLFKTYPVPFYMLGGVTTLLTLRFVLGGKKKVYIPRLAANPKRKKRKSKKK